MLQSKIELAKGFRTRHGTMPIHNRWAQAEMDMQKAISEGDQKLRMAEAELEQVKSVLRDKRTILAGHLCKMLASSSKLVEQQNPQKAFDACWAGVVKVSEASFGVRLTRNALRDLGY